MSEPQDPASLRKPADPPPEELGPAGSPIVRYQPAPASGAAALAVAPSDLKTLRRRPTYVFFGSIAAASLFADIASKAWAEVVLSKRTMQEPSITLIRDHLSF